MRVRVLMMIISDEKHGRNGEQALVYLQESEKLFLCIRIGVGCF